MSIQFWTELHGAGAALALADAACQAQQPFLVITPDSHSATQLADELVFFRNEDCPILHFPDWETLPYDHFSPHQDIISERLSTLYRLPSLQQGIVIAPISTLMHRLPPQNYLIANTFIIDVGEQVNLNGLRKKLELGGYRCVSQVMEHGEFAIRGSIMDLYPMGADLPFRLDLFDNEIETIRIFDPETQRSTEKVDKIRLLPAREFPLTEESITRFRQNFREQFSGNPSLCTLYEDVSQGIAPAGIEYYLSLFFENTCNLFDYLPAAATVVRFADISSPAETFWHEIKERYAQRSHDITRPIPEPMQVFIPAAEILAASNRFDQIQMQKQNEKKFPFATQPAPQLTINHKAKQPLAVVAEFLQQTNTRVLFCVESAGRREALLALLKTIDITPTVVATWQDFLSDTAKFAITIAPLAAGLQLTDSAITLIAESQLFSQQVMQRRRRKGRQIDTDTIVRDLTELHIGDPVVHIDHGVGRYLGLQTLEVAKNLTEFLTLEYAGGDRIYVPVTGLELISRYSGADSDSAPLNKLGSEQWARAKRKAAEKIRDVAAELLDIHAKRAARMGFKFSAPSDNYFNFSNSFPFEETPDQERAINEVIADMHSEKAMDRLVCGDVGFGKTEVAMRAAFLAVQDGKQVAILVPTTLLADQHFQNFQDRFADWPVNIDLLSRFRSTKQQEATIANLKSGKIDIIIGTHKLIQQSIAFKNLGLLIVDEEHRFGVRQKEHLKAMRAEVDILTLTATPIPRTLNMSMAGMRDISIIATPPAKRLSIKTFVQQQNNTIIREAILREILRGGQVYYLHNKVDTIQRIAQQVCELVPEAKVNISHGQMREIELEQVMTDFYHQRFNVLVCTTIIETGIDIPTANTIIIDRADHFGLAQLHQLRGRVGRSHHQAYAYLMTPHEKAMTNDAKKRLEAITSLEDLGAGFTLASHDLEIRGAGELLGEDQSGQMHTIGFSLYLELLDRAMAALRAGKQPELEKPFSTIGEIDCKISALIPENYLPDIHTRLTLYKRIANAKTHEQLRELQVEMIDRFGLLPEATKNLFEISELKLKARALKIIKIDANDKGGRVEFADDTPVNPETIIQLIQQQPQRYSFAGQNKLRFAIESDDAPTRIAVLEKLLTTFAI